MEWKDMQNTQTNNFNSYDIREKESWKDHNRGRAEEDRCQQLKREWNPLITLQLVVNSNRMLIAVAALHIGLQLVSVSVVVT